ncbi:cell division protein SepF [Candidatus Woesearchaeota archaeon]|nr:cell division protein SepF [Candidatus Woesearchaeota archaeon]
MKEALNKIKEKISGSRDYDYEDYAGDYLEVEPEKKEFSMAKAVIRPFVITDFTDIKPVLDALREGSTIVLLNIAPLRDKDIVELKRAVNKLKKTCDALEGDIAGFGEDWIVATPNFAYVHRDRHVEEISDTSEE